MSGRNWVKISLRPKIVVILFEKTSLLTPFKVWVKEHQVYDDVDL
jgi:hypothetical protein